MSVVGIIIVDISKFFNTIDHDLLMKAVERHVQEKWILLYHPTIPFERYADDTICHCYSLEEAQMLKASIVERFAACKLRLNEKKTRIVYCKDGKRREEYKDITFDFLGYTFQPRGQRNKQGQVFNGYAPAISRKSKKRITETMRGWHLNRRVQLKLSDIAVEINAEVRGWMNYYGKFYGSQLKAFLQCVNLKLARWAERKYKRFRRKPNDAYKWLVRVASKNPALFYHWQHGVKPNRLKPFG